MNNFKFERSGKMAGWKVQEIIIYAVVCDCSQN